MQWLSQYWIWIVFAVGILLLMRRGGFGFGMGHGSHSRSSSDTADQIRDSDSRPVDPVNGELVSSALDVNSMYQGRLYHFVSRENRDKFEASPAQYASLARDHDAAHRHHRHGC